MSSLPTFMYLTIISLDNPMKKVWYLHLIESKKAKFSEPLRELANVTQLMKKG